MKIKKVAAVLAGCSLVLVLCACGHGFSLGDVNHDGKVNIEDANLILKYSIGLCNKDDLDLKAADVNADKRIDKSDAMLIMKIEMEGDVD